MRPHPLRGANPEMPPSDQARWFSENVQPYEPALRAYLSKRFPTLTDHDDLVQESYTRILQARQTGRLTHAKAFLFTVARNAAIDVFRRRRTTTHETISEHAERSLLEESLGVGDALDEVQRRELLIEAVAALPERCRQVMMLRYLDGLAYKEIGARLGISPETVKVHMMKGVRDCTAFFARHGLLEAAPAEDVLR